MAAYTATAALGAPLLWNNSYLPLAKTGSPQGVMAVLLGFSVAWTTAPAASGTCGIAVGLQGETAPTSLTNISLAGNVKAGGRAPYCITYNKGTVANAPTAFHLTHSLSTAGTPSDVVFYALDGLIQVPPTYYAAVCSSATLGTVVTAATLIWAEVPL